MYKCENCNKEYFKKDFSKKKLISGFAFDFVDGDNAAYNPNKEHPFDKFRIVKCPACGMYPPERFS